MKKTILLILAFAIPAALAGCGTARNTPESATGYYFDTVVIIDIYGGSGELISGAMELCAVYESVFSKTDPDSEVSRINSAGGAQTQVSSEMSEVLEKALYYSELSDGGFDVTIGTVAALWDFTSGAAELPEEEDLLEAAELVDYRRLNVDGNSVTLPEGMAIDLGAIAKGYISDRVADFLRENGAESCLLRFGGNIVAVGRKPDGSQWRIGVRDPFSDTGESVAVIGVEDRAVVTSGTYERGFDLGGVRYHHLLDPDTGYPYNNGLVSVTVICERAADADALSTALFSMGAREGLKAAEALDGTEAVFITEEGEITYTSGLEGLITFTGPDKS